jgi:ribosomal protein S16
MSYRYIFIIQSGLWIMVTEDAQKPKQIRAPWYSDHTGKYKPLHNAKKISFEIYFLRDLISKGALTLDVVEELLVANGHKPDRYLLKRILVDDADKDLPEEAITTGLVRALDGAAFAGGIAN